MTQNIPFSVGDIHPEGSRVLQGKQHLGTRTPTSQSGNQLNSLAHTTSKCDKSPDTSGVCYNHFNFVHTYSEARELSSSSVEVAQHSIAQANSRKVGCTDTLTGDHFERQSSDRSHAAVRHHDLLKQLDSKKSTGDSSHAAVTRSVVDVHTLEGSQLEEVRRRLENAEEVAMTLLYTDGSSLLHTLGVSFALAYNLLCCICNEHKSSASSHLHAKVVWPSNDLLQIDSAGIHSY